MKICSPFCVLVVVLSVAIAPYTFAQKAPTILQSSHATAIDNSQQPLWQQMLYSDNPNWRLLQTAYEDFYRLNPFVKSIHTQNYKRWISLNRSFFAEDGRVLYPTADQRQAAQLEIKNLKASTRGGGNIWSYAGPEVQFVNDGTLTEGFRHSNIYCHDRSLTNPNLLYCGAESCGAFKSVDGGLNWENVTADLILEDVQSIRIHPQNENLVIMSSSNDLRRTDDGGATWSVIGQASFANQNIRAWQIEFNPENPDIIYAACNLGFFRSTDGGNIWIEVLNGQCKTIAIQPDNPAVIYTIQEVDTHNSKFYKSTDYGATWTMYDSGWFDNSTNEILPEGGRLATTAADPNRIYAILVGYQENNSSVITNGWIGAWVSYDAGVTWSFPHAQLGTPYTDEHQNLMNFDADDGDYTQINYNTTLIASQLDADKVLIGGLNLWKSNDACATYTGVGGYIGGIEYFHVDQQEYHIYKTSETTEEIFFSNDGGFGFSGDFMESHVSLNRGIQAVNLWGYDQGWNEDMMVAGRYHNGNMAYHEEYEEGEFFELGGGEAPTGYVNYTDENETFFSDIGGYVLPDNLSEIATTFSTSVFPNESYYTNNSSRILFDNSYFDVAWLGKANKIFRSTNGGSTFSEFYSFSSNPNDQVLWIEQSYADAQYMYLHFVSDNQSHIYHTEDGGISWTEINIPSTLREMTFTTSGENPDELWVAYYYGSNGNKIYHTIDGGANWDNITTSDLNNKEIWSIAAQFGTDGGVYIGMKNGLVYYRNNGMSNWVSYSTGLPASTQPLRIVPFYKGEMIRLATWNLGVWEAPFYESSLLMADFSAQHKTFFCPGDSIHFVDHSVAGINATYSWNFPGAIPSMSNLKNPTVIYLADGTYDVTLTVSENGNEQTVTKTSYINSVLGGDLPLAENFETAVFPEDWKPEHSSGGNGFWSINSNVGGFGLSDHSMNFDNYNYDALGNYDEEWTGKLAVVECQEIPISFDVAYARYAENYSDTLAVLVSYDCGDSWTTVYVKGGTTLSTSPDLNVYFTPNADQWRTDSITFTTTAAADMIVAFQNRGHYGNVIYVDNIQILSGTNCVAVKEEQSLDFTIYPNPTDDYLQISAMNLPAGNLTCTILDNAGKIVLTENIFSSGGRLEKRLDTGKLSSGFYTLRLSTDKDQWIKSLEIR